MTTPHTTRPDDESGSLAMAMLLSIVGFALGALLLPIVIRHIDSTRTVTASGQALHAAQAGLDVALGHIRAARTARPTDDGATGDWRRLPCGSLSGTVDAANSYRVHVTYLAEDPHGHDPTWVAGHALPCRQNTAAYALLTSAGRHRPSTGARLTTRTLTATYTMAVSGNIVAGGKIHVQQVTSFCFDAGSGQPAVGTPVLLRFCAPGDAAHQTFAYTSDLTIVLTSTRRAAHPAGMCVDAGSPQGAGTILTLQWCAGPDHPSQQWGFPNGNYLNAIKNRQITTRCIAAPGGVVDGSALHLVEGSAGCLPFSPDATVGAGRAGIPAPPTSSVAGQRQLVNFQQFGRCLDVTRWDVTLPFLHIWPCKQALDLADVDWNQRWTVPEPPNGQGSATGPIWTVNGGWPTGRPGDNEPWCLTSPLIVGAYPRMKKCADDPAMTWTRVGETASYATGYLIKDSAGNCLRATDPDIDESTEGAQNKISKGVMAACDGSTWEKWNAPPSILDLPLKDIHEQ